MARRSAEDAIDWGAIEKQYRLGQKSNLQLASEYNVDPSSIGKRAKKMGWVVDKREEVDVVTNSLLIQSSLGNSDPNSTPSKLEIKAAAQANADVIMGHRKSLGRQLVIENKLTDSLEDAIQMLGNVDELMELVRVAAEDPNEYGAAMKAVHRLANRSTLIDDYKKLVEASDKRRKGEREAFGIDGDVNDKSGVEDMLKKLGQVS